MYVTPISKQQLIKACVIAMTVIAAIIFAHTLVRAVWMDDPDNSGVNVPLIASSTADSARQTGEPAFPGYPIRLLVPSADIDAAIKGVGVTASGNMATAGNFTDVGWYKYGTVPGMKGSAVMDGHVDNALSLDGVFKHIDGLVPGDDIYVLTDAGNTLHFRVTAADAYDYQSVPIDLIFNDKTGSRLRLITCTGSWVQANKTYDKRLVVTADLLL